MCFVCSPNADKIAAQIDVPAEVLALSLLEEEGPKKPKRKAGEFTQKQAAVKKFVEDMLLTKVHKQLSIRVEALMLLTRCSTSR